MAFDALTINSNINFLIKLVIIIATSATKKEDIRHIQLQTKTFYYLIYTLCFITISNEVIIEQMLMAIYYR